MRNTIKTWILLSLFLFLVQPFQAEEEFLLANKEDCYWEDLLCGYDAYYDYMYDVGFNCNQATSYFVLCERTYFRSYNSSLLSCNANYIKCVKKAVQGK